MTRRALLLSAALPDPAAELKQLEARAGGRLGVALFNAKTGRLIGNRLDEPFAMCSTFKLPLVAIILREADAGRLQLDEPVHFTKADMVPWAPVTSAHLAEGRMSIEALAEATQTTSDNPAANLLLKKLGGPAALTAKLREVGARATRIDRFEPLMNLVLPGDTQDTTTPRDMARLTARFVIGDALKPESREKLIGWMIATKTGAKRIRAGLPPQWRSGDKTGSGLHSTMTDKTNDVAVTWPTGRPAIVIAAYYDSSRTSPDTRDEDQAVLAEVGRIAAAWVSR